MRTSATLTAVVVAAALAVAGCGGSSGDEQQVKNTVTTFMSALARGDGAKACALATSAAQQHLVGQASQAGGNCQAIIATISKRLPASVKQGLESAKVKKATVKGDTATVSDKDISSSSGDLSPFLGSGSTTLKKENGQWKLAS
jgi:hypothetical protein